MIAGYQKFLENDLTGLTSSTVSTKNIMTQYGQGSLRLDAHSRGSLTVGNAMKSLEKYSDIKAPLKGTDINLYGPAYNAQTAAKQLGQLSGGAKTVVKLQNHDKDFVGSELVRCLPHFWQLMLPKFF